MDQLEAEGVRRERYRVVAGGVGWEGRALRGRVSAPCPSGLGLHMTSAAAACDSGYN